MWLEAGEELDDIIPGVRLAKGERILMEVSRKFTQEKLRALAFQSGFFWQVMPAPVPVLVPDPGKRARWQHAWGPPLAAPHV